ncbi:hypothetical protein [Herbidospora sp. RD11066]
MTPGRLLTALALAALTACATTPPPPDPVAAPSDRYMTGTEPGDDPCQRVVSALGFAEIVLKPAGQEEGQEFGEGVRGRIAYGEGVILTYGAKLPAELAEHTATLKRVIRELVPAATPHEKAVAALKEWRAAATAIERVCAGKA